GRGDPLRPGVHVPRLGFEAVTRDRLAAVAEWTRQLLPRCLRVVLGRKLVVNPAVRLFHAVTQSRGRLPTQILADLGVIAVATRDAARRIELVPPVELNARDVLGDVHELVDRYQLRTAEVDRFEDVRVRDRLDAPQAIVDVHKRSRL